MINWNQIASFGLCAFMYGIVAKFGVPGDTGSFLLILGTRTVSNETNGLLS